ncbi:MAG: hypothetical protein AAGA58_05660 [Verrucomicrobiota bacterium]
MAVSLNGPKNQDEIDRNLLIIGWLLIVPSISLLIIFNGYILALLLIGGFSRLLVTAIRLPNREMEYIRYLFVGFPILTGLYIHFELLSDWIFLVGFWSFLLYSEWRFFVHNRAEQGVDLNS